MTLRLKYLVSDAIEYGKWSHWGECSETCGLGVKKRTRERVDIHPDAFHEKFYDILECDVAVCPGKCFLR